MREVQDHWFREAKRQGFRSRAAFKLLEIDERRKILKKGDVVLDAGAAPGSWCQVAAKKVGRTGRVVGVDLKPIERGDLPPEIDLIEGDLRSYDPAASGIDRFDVVLSDMAPDTTGDHFGDHHRSIRLCHELLDRCSEWLKPGGNLVLKVFEGEAYRDLLDRMSKRFGTSKGFKPKASRSESVEMFVFGIDHDPKGDIADGDGPDEPALPPRRRPPSPGWNS